MVCDHYLWLHLHRSMIQDSLDVYSFVGFFSFDIMTCLSNVANLSTIITLVIIFVIVFVSSVLLRPLSSLSQYLSNSSILWDSFPYFEICRLLRNICLTPLYFHDLVISTSNLSMCALTYNLRLHCDLNLDVLLMIFLPSWLIEFGFYFLDSYWLIRSLVRSICLSQSFRFIWLNQFPHRVMFPINLTNFAPQFPSSIEIQKY